MVEMAIYDGEGNRRDAYWLADNYGQIGVTQTGSDYGLVELRENTGGSAALVVTCLDENRQGLPGRVVIFGWPDGQNQGVTDQNGAVGFGMGPGAYYKPDVVGPHYVATGRMLVTGLGMKYGSNHYHLDIVLIRAGDEPAPDPTGACCMPDGWCADAMTESDCIAQGGTYQGDDTKCADIDCSGGPPPDPTGACCLPSGQCLDDVTEQYCAARGGIYQGDDVKCSDIDCPEEPQPPVENVWMTLFEKLDRIIELLEILCTAG